LAALQIISGGLAPKVGGGAHKLTAAAVASSMNG